MELLAQKLGIKLEFVTDKWSVLLKKFANKELDIMHVMSASDEARHKYTLFTKPYLSMKLSIITQKGSNIKSLNDLKNKRLAMVKGWTTTKFVKKNHPSIKIIEKNYSQETLNAVAFGEADAAIEDFFISNYFINKNFLSNIQIASNINIPTYNQDLHIGVRNDWPLLHGIFEKVLKSISEEELMKLNQKWMMIFGHEAKPSILLTKEEADFINKHPVIKVGGETDWPPYDYVENGEYKGLANEYLKIISKNTGLKFDIKTGYTWEQLLNMVQNKQLDMLPILYYSDSRTEYLNYTKKYLTIRHYLYTADDDTKNYSSLNDLNGKTIAVPKGFAQIEILKKEYPKIKILEAENSLDAIDKVVTKKADAFIENTALVDYLLKRHNIKGIKSVFATELGVNELYMGIRKDWPILRDIIQKGLNSITYEQVDKTLPGSKQRDGFQNKLTRKEKKYLKNKKEITMCVDPDWMPYDKIENGKYIGIGSDYIKLFEKKLNVKFKLIPTKNWNESKQKARDRICEVLPLSSDSEKRREFMNVTTPYINEPLVIATKLKINFITDFSDLKGKKIGIVRGYSLVKRFRDKFPYLEIVETNNINDGLKKVANGELFGQVDAISSINYYIQEFFWGELKVSGKFNEFYKLGMASNKDDLILHNILEKTVSNISNDEHQSIYRKWYTQKEIVETIDYTLVWYILITVFVIIVIILYWNYKLNKQKEGFETLFENSSDGISILNKEHVFIQCNQKVLDILKYASKDDILYQHPSKFSPEYQPDGRKSFEKAEEMMNLAIQKQGHRFEWMHVRADGKKFWAEITLTPMILDGKEAIHVIWRDISDKKENERLLIEQSKMAAIGDMIANIAHQWRQPLCAITAAATGLKVQKEFGTLTDDLFIESIDGINNSAQHLSETIDTFRDFIKEEKKLKEVILQKRIDVALGIIQTTLKNKHINLINNIDYTNPIKINLVLGELVQVIINITNNAKDILIEKNIENPWIKLDLQKLDDKAVLIIEDNGGGIPDDIMPKIFEPYFTTKHQSQGTGLGLHMSYKIITESLKGKLYAKNTENGAKFYIELPLS